MAVALLAVVGLVALAGFPLGWYAKPAPLVQTALEAGQDPFSQSFATPHGVDAQTLRQHSQVGGARISNGAVQGTARGLYGGPLDVQSCDAAVMIEFLADNPDKADAFAGVVGESRDSLENYLRGLTSVVLLRDTWVTNHGFENGVATPYQAVLQAGTAVTSCAWTRVPTCRRSSWSTSTPGRSWSARWGSAAPELCRSR